MQQIEQQRVTAYNGQPRQANIRQGGDLRPQSVEIEPGPEQKEPRQQGEIVRGRKGGGGKTQTGGGEICVLATGQPQQRHPSKAEIAVVYIPCQQKQGKAENKLQPGRDPGQQRTERDSQQGCSP